MSTFAPKRLGPVGETAGRDVADELPTGRLIHPPDEPATAETKEGGAERLRANTCHESYLEELEHPPRTLGVEPRPDALPHLAID